MSNYLSRFIPARMLLPMLAAAVVFLLASGTIGGYDGASYAQSAQPGSTNPGEPLPGGSPQEGELETSGPNGQRQSCKSFEESAGGFLLGRIVPCLTKTIEHSGNRMSREMIEVLRPVLSAFLTFVIVIFGIQVLQNEGQLQTRAFVLLLKIGFCFAILAMIPGDEDTNEGGLIGTAYAIMAESQAVVMSSIGPDTANINCAIERFGDENTPMIWKQMDCLLSKLYGFTVGTPGPSGEARPNMLLASSVVGLMGGFFFNSSFGVALFFACIGMLVGMFVLVLRVLVAFLNSYMFIAFYMILAPLLLPLMFLRVTTSMFEKWYSGILAALLLPMVICAYVVLALQVYDKLFFADDAMITKLFDNQLMDCARQLPKSTCDQSIANSAGFRADATGRTEKEIYTDNLFLRNINPLVSTANNLCGGLTSPNLKLEQCLKGKDGKATSGKEIFEKLFTDCLKLFIVSMLINMGFTTIMAAVRPMLGSGAVVAAMETGTTMETKFRQGVEGAKQGFAGAFNVRNERGEVVPTSGPDFMRQVPTAFGEGGKGFLRGMGMINEDAAPPAAKGGAGAGGAGSGGTSPRGGSGGDSGSSGSSGADKGGDDGDDSGSKGGSGGGSTARGGAGAGAGSNAAPGRAPVKNMTPSQQREAAESVLSADELRRFDELGGQLYNARLEPGKRDELNAEYERLLDRIEELSNRGG